MTRRLIALVERLPLGEVTKRALVETLADWHHERRGLLAAVVRLAMRSVLSMVQSTRAAGNPWRSLDQDIKHAWRLLWRSPLQTTVAIAILALGIGANTVLFSLFNGVMLRALPVPNLDRIAIITNGASAIARDLSIDESEARAFVTSGGPITATFTSDPLTGAVVADGQSAIVAGELVSGPYFGAFALHAVAGRLLDTADDQSAGQIPAVISERLSRQLFGGPSVCIGKTLRMAGNPMIVVGVVPETFGGTWLPTMLHGDLWVPSRASGDLRTVQGTAIRSTRHRTFAVLASGATLAAANAAVRTIGATLPVTRAGQTAQFFSALPAERGMLFDDFATPGRIAGSAVVTLSALVFLIACANLANLLLARGTARVPEVAVRIAAGATRFRVVRLFLVETIVLAGAAAVVSAAITIVGTRALQAVDLPALAGLRIAVNLSPDLRVLTYGLLISGLAAVAVGIIPAWRASCVPAVEAMKRGGAGTGTVRRSRMMSALVATQVALSLALLVSAGLYAKSVTVTAGIDSGFDTEHTVMATTDLRMYRIEEPQGRRVFERVLDTVASMPDVASAALASSLPARTFGGRSQSSFVLGEGQAPRQTPFGLVGVYSRFIVATPRYFSTLRIVLREGRDFTERDDQGAPAVVIVNETLARALWPEGAAVGRRVSLAKDGPLTEVIGVAADTGSTVIGSAGPVFYRPARQQYDGSMTIVARARDGQSASALVASLQQRLRSTDFGIAFFDERTVGETLAIATLPTRLAAGMLAALGAIALGIAVIGVYGVVANVASRRVREFGIRKALGATEGRLYIAMLRQSLGLLLPGLAAGLVLAFISGAFLRVLLFGVSQRDPAIFVGVTIALLVAGLAACYLPARRASRVDPNVALREL